MFKFRNIFRIVSGSSTLFALAVFTGCRFRPLEDPEYNTRLNVRVNTDAISNVTCDIYNPKLKIQEIAPVAMHVLFYDVKSNAVAAESFISEVSADTDGTRVLSGNLQLSPGHYRMLVYDFGTDAVKVQDYSSWNTAEAVTDPVPSSVKNVFGVKADGSGAVDIREQPEHLVVARNSDEHVPYHEGVYTIETEAETVVESYYLQIKVDGLEYVSSAQAVLTGMVGSNLISSGRWVSEPPVAVWFRLEKSDDGGVPVICTVFNTFGRIDSSGNSLEVTFDIKTKTGDSVRRTFDISDLFLSENSMKHHWLLLDETIKIDPPVRRRWLLPEAGRLGRGTQGTGIMKITIKIL